MSWRRIMFAVASTEVIESSALHKVARIAGALDAEVELFHCIFEPRVVRPARLGLRVIESDIRDAVEERRHQLEAAAERLRREHIRVRIAVRWDTPPWQGIVRQVLRYRPDLLMLQSTRRGRVARLALTHTDLRVLEDCPCAVLLIKTERPWLEPRVIAAVDPRLSHGKPAVLDDAVLAAAGTVADALGGESHVYHSCPAFSAISRQLLQVRGLDPGVLEDLRARYCDDARAMVTRLAARWHIPRQRVHVEEGETARALPAFAKRLGADIVALGAVGRTSLASALVGGHTAERVLDALDSDVLVLKTPGFRNTVRVNSVHRLPKREAQRARYVL
jgi:universal stress protein E